MISEKFISGATARGLRGRMVFADAQLFGRTGKRCVQVLSRYSQRGKSHLSDDDCFFLSLFVEILMNGKPRTIQKVATQQVLIFTDAWYEKEARSRRGGVGGVLIDLAVARWEFFSIELTDDMLFQLGEAHRAQLILEAETLAAVLSFMLWSEVFSGRLGHLFIDNEGTKFSLLRGVSENECVNKLAQIFAKHEMQSAALIWISRVASHTNIADGCNFVVKRNALIDHLMQDCCWTNSSHNAKWGMGCVTGRSPFEKFVSAAVAYR